MLPSGASWRDFLCTLKHVIVQQGEGPEAPAHEQHVLLVQRLLWDLQLPCTGGSCQLNIAACKRYSA